jgi:hypothetical protein
MGESDLNKADDSLVNVHTYSAESLPFGRDLISAEEEAKKAQKNVSCCKGFGLW